MSAAAAGVAMLGGAAFGAITGRAREGQVHAVRSLPHAVSTPVSGTLQIRRNARDLASAERRALVDAILALKDKPSPWMPGLNVYDTFVVWHRDALGCGVMAAHMGPAFLPWHRQFLRLFELELQAVDPSVVLPYWDWTVDNTADAYLWDDDFMGGNGDREADGAVMTGPFRKGEWALTVFDYDDQFRDPYITRDFGASSRAPELPTAEEIEAILNNPVYDAPPWNSTVPTEAGFRNALEGWIDCSTEVCNPNDGLAPVCTGPAGGHNRVHAWVAGSAELAIQEDAVEAGGAETIRVFGTMAYNTSLNDPVFWLHHANIDRLWSEWLRRHGAVFLPETGGPHGHNIDDPMWPFDHLGMTVTPRMMLSSRDLGYVYDTEA